MAKAYLKEILQLTIEKFKQNGTFDLDENKILEKEYQEVEQVLPTPGEAWGQHEAMVNQGLCKKACQFPQMNRYCNLFPFDENIVNLQNPDHYINASWMKIMPWLPNRKFIVTMGPMHPSSYNSKMKSDFDEESPNNTCPNFWEMIWETKSKLVVMLCELAPGFTGCSEYFPTNEDQTAQHGNFVIKNISKNHQNATCHRIFEVSKTNTISSNETGSEEKLIVNHLQFTKWPNYGVPDSVGPISDFIKLVHQKANELEAKDPELVIHCSGGIGRSGTFLTAYGAYSHFLQLSETNFVAKKAEPICLVKTVKEFRGQRHPWMVEGLHQYQMAYIIILHLLKQATAD